MSWDVAMKMLSRGGHIATITSEAEWHAIGEELRFSFHGYYLGGTDEKLKVYGNGLLEKLGSSPNGQRRAKCLSLNSETRISFKH